MAAQSPDHPPTRPPLRPPAAGAQDEASRRLSDACTLVLRTLAISRGPVPRPAMELQLLCEAELHRGEEGGAKGLLHRALQQLVGDRFLQLPRHPGRAAQLLVPLVKPGHVGD
jgi:hypothetical protein